MLRFTIAGAFGLAAFVSSACVHEPAAHEPGVQTCDVSVNSFASAEARTYKKYFLVAPSPDANQSTLEFQEYGSYVHRALAMRGFTLVRSIDEAQIAVYLTYGVGDPQQQVYSTSHTVLAPRGLTQAYSTDSRAVYQRFAKLTAIDMPRYTTEHRSVEVWTTTISSTGPSADMRSIFPILIAASADMIGVNSRGTSSRVVDVNTQTVMVVR